MKYLTPLFLALALAGCSSEKKEKQDVPPAASESPASTTAPSTASPASAAAPASETAKEVTIKYKDKDNKTYELKTSNNFQTAVLTDNEGKTYELKEAISGSGMRLEGKDGVYIHTKGEEGSLELVKGKLIDIKEVK